LLEQQKTNESNSKGEGSGRTGWGLVGMKPLVGSDTAAKPSVDENS